MLCRPGWQYGLSERNKSRKISTIHYVGVFADPSDTKTSDAIPSVPHSVQWKKRPFLF